MDGKQLNVIKKAIQEKKTVVDFNQTWQTLYKDHNVGKRQGRQLVLKPTDLELLTAIYHRYVKVAPIVNIDLQQNRMTLVDYFKDEKIGGFNVFADQLVFASARVELPLKTGYVNIAFKGLLTTTTLENVEISAIQRLVIIENGAMMTRLFDWYQNLEVEWQNSLFVYRGHGANVKVVIQLLEQLPRDTSVAFYGDFDPYGINIASHFYKFHSLALIMPEVWQQITVNHVDNNLEKFLKQIVHSRDIAIDQDVPTIFRQVYQHIKHNQLAIMQENVNRIGRLVALMYDQV
ncbi:MULTISPECIES: DUF7281 domain-containing protein [Acinetobacter]|uniref:DUF7281 domain-containing protein n=1 Tax=Acinetobacter TaxID=469 RepID=UPI0039895966